MNRFSEQPENTSTKRKLTDNLLIIYILTTLLILLGQIMGSLLGFIPFMTSNDVITTITMYLSFL